MNHQYFLFQPLAWAIAFAFGSVMLKRAIETGLGPLRIAFINNVVIGLMFLPGLLTLPRPFTWQMLFWPFISSVVYTSGQVCFFVAMRIGDVSVLGPALGAKVVFVAFFSYLLAAGIMPWTWWVAAFLAAGAVFLLGLSNWHDRKRLARTAVLAVMAAALYGFNDVLVQQHAPAVGAPGFSALMFGGVGLEAFGLVPFFSEPFRAVPRAAWPWALWGGVVCAAQSGGMAYTLGHYGQATAINVVYSTRGLWSILVVWLLGSWFGNYERDEGRGVMVRRLAGALLLLGAVGLVLVEG
jgi:drug/metabolite transporter (DMT)-like permease